MKLEEIREMLNPNTPLDSQHINVVQGKKITRAELSGVTLNTQTKSAELTYTLPDVERKPRQAKPEATPEAKPEAKSVKK